MDKKGSKGGQGLQYTWRREERDKGGKGEGRAAVRGRGKEVQEITSDQRVERGYGAERPRVGQTDWNLLTTNV